MMKTKKLIEYLQGFDKESVPVILAINPKKRVKYELQGTILITDQEQPVIGLEMGAAVPFDEEEVRAAEEEKINEDNTNV